MSSVPDGIAIPGRASGQRWREAAHKDSVGSCAGGSGRGLGTRGALGLRGAGGAECASFSKDIRSPFRDLLLRCCHVLQKPRAGSAVPACSAERKAPLRGQELISCSLLKPWAPLWCGFLFPVFPVTPSKIKPKRCTRPSTFLAEMSLFQFPLKSIAFSSQADSRAATVLMCGVNCKVIGVFGFSCPLGNFLIFVCKGMNERGPQSSPLPLKHL